MYICISLFRSRKFNMDDLKILITIFLLLFCNSYISAQEPDVGHEISDVRYETSDTIRTELETSNLNDEALTEGKLETSNPEPEPKPEIILITDDTDLSKIFKFDTLGYSKHSPAKAAMMSAVLPGLGQIYNGKYWKVPIVYIAIGISAERFLTFQNQYTRFRRAYVEMRDQDPYTNYHHSKSLGLPSWYTDAQIEQSITKGKDKLRTWRDYAIVAVVASYALTIIDANVDAHLMDFSLDDNISLNIRPCFLENSIFSKKIGLTLQFSF